MKENRMVEKRPGSGERNAIGKARVGGLAFHGMRVSLACMLLVGMALDAYPANRNIFDEKFRQQIERIGAETPGAVGVAIIDMKEGRLIGINENETFPTASSIKLLIDVALYAKVSEGSLNLNDRVQPEPVNQGNGLTLGEASRLMIDKSDNDATNMIIDTLGMDYINSIATGLGLSSMKLRRRMLDQSAIARGQDNASTPADGARLMAMMLRCGLPMRHELCQAMNRMAFKAYPEGPVRQAIPSHVPVIQMPGGLPGVRTSWGVADLPGRPFAISVMGSFGDRGIITQAISEITELTYRYFQALANHNELGVAVQNSHVQ